VQGQRAGRRVADRRLLIVGAHVIRTRAEHDHTYMRRHAMLAALLGATLLAGCGDKADTGTPAPAAAATDAIQIKDFLFVPDPVTVKAGVKIAVSNTDKAPHTVTEVGGSPSFDSGTIKGGESGSVTFSKPGTYKYFCEFHATMKGTVTVVQ
jgi:plastocyanin